jgi:hypothetical protein
MYCWEASNQIPKGCVYVTFCSLRSTSVLSIIFLHDFQSNAKAVITLAFMKERSNLLVNMHSLSTPELQRMQLPMTHVLVRLCLPNQVRFVDPKKGHRCCRQPDLEEMNTINIMRLIRIQLSAFLQTEIRHHSPG